MYLYYCCFNKVLIRHKWTSFSIYFSCFLFSLIIYCSPTIIFPSTLWYLSRVYQLLFGLKQGSMNWPGNVNIIDDVVSMEKNAMNSRRSLEFGLFRSQSQKWQGKIGSLKSAKGHLLSWSWLTYLPCFPLPLLLDLLATLIVILHSMRKLWLNVNL